MAALALGDYSTGGINYVRLLVKDAAASAAGGGLTDAQITAVINEKYAWYREEVDVRAAIVPPPLLLTSTAAGASLLLDGQNTTVATNIRKVLALYAGTGSTTIANCTTAASTTVTTSGTFAAVKIGDYVTGTGVSANAFVVSKESTTSLTVSVAGTVQTPVSLTFWHTNQNSAPFTRVELNEFFDHAGASLALLSEPVYALERPPALKGKWLIHCANHDAIGYVSTVGVVAYEVTALSAAADIPDLSDHEGYIVYRLAAIECARMLGRSPEFIASLNATLPREFQVATTTGAFLKGPRPRPAEEAF